jgi:D-xylose reductase
MEQLVDDKLVRNIGLSNTQGSLLIDVNRYARHPISVLQIEHHPYLTQEPLVKLCKDLGIAVTGYSSFGPASFVELSMDRGSQSLLESSKIASIAQQHGKSEKLLFLLSFYWSRNANWITSYCPSPPPLGNPTWHRCRPQVQLP